MAEFVFKATKDCEFVADNADGSQTWRGIVVTGKGNDKREEPCEFLFWPTLAAATAATSEEEVLDKFNRQVKTDAYNAVRNGLNATPTARGAVNRALKALQEGRMSPEDAKRIFEQAMAAIATADDSDSNVA